jgi:hypothetical protein
MNALRLIDDFLFDRVFQRLVNSFPFAGPAGVARILLVGSAASLTIMTATEFPFDPWREIFHAYVFIKLYFEADFPRAKLGMRNPKRIERIEFFLRLFAVGLSIAYVLALPFDFGLESNTVTIGWLLLTSYFYARACDKLPPAHSRSVWWASLFAVARA